ncbi:translation elongation factor Ts [Paracoccus sp. (in: a-proteobacteria)]|uniref:translation elongation factor Ts n=1 Tax=Paracoccus sp. TaxID=267 RepID=UPI0026DFDAD1|nr:translation elongation factor Ts [Paracoccus sp. (in: a-proteobacteria)]MDO5370215.1 translation elongation factor Ts [Paracoccus sp. (in: a-proteobacteria)]
MAITAAMVKELRESTGAGMMDAKKALQETSGDMDAAVDWLRTKGLAKAAKKSGRIAAEGLVAVAVEGGKGVAVEVNSETDFVAKNEAFQSMVREIAQTGLTVDSTESLAAAQLNGKPVGEVVTEAIARIGENLTLRRMVTVSGENVVSYVHNAAAPNMGKIGVLVALKGDAAKAQEIGKQIAMHIAATSPASLSEADLDPALVEREKSVLTEQARESGKPDAVIEKMIVGRMSKFFEEVTLLGQKFVINPDVTVAEAAKEAGVEVTGYARVAVGEGIEKKEEDFAAEVAKTLKGA